jgi:hypothetical protein
MKQFCSEILASYPICSGTKGSASLLANMDSRTPTLRNKWNVLVTMDTEITVLSLYSRVQHKRRWHWFAFLVSNVTVLCSRPVLFVVKISFQVNSGLLLFSLQPVANESILRKPHKLPVVLKCTLFVFSCLFKTANRDLMKRGNHFYCRATRTQHDWKTQYLCPYARYGKTLWTDRDI